MVVGVRRSARWVGERKRTKKVGNGREKAPGDNRVEGYRKGGFDTQAQQIWSL